LWFGNGGPGHGAVRFVRAEDGGGPVRGDVLFLGTPPGVISHSTACRRQAAWVRIPIESDHPFRPNPIADSGVSDHLAGAGVS